MMKVCPKCGSRDIEPAHDKLFKMGRELQEYVCNDCGYIGSLVLSTDSRPNKEMEKDLERAKE
jgi:transposase-like protein